MDVHAAQRRKIRELLKEQSRSQEWLARKIGESKQNVGNWLQEEAPTTPRRAEVFSRMLEALGAGDLDRVLIPAGFRAPMIRLAGNVPAGDWGDPLASEEFVEVTDVKFAHPKRFAAYVIGDSCSPCLQPGDLTVWHVDNNPMYGRFVLAQRKGDHGCTVKELTFDVERNRHVLKPINPSYTEPEDGDGWGVIARLVGVVFDNDGLQMTLYQEKGLTKKHLSFRQIILD